MQTNPWRKEQLLSSIFIIIAIVSGLVSGYWTLSLLMCALIYIVWKSIEFYYFYKWYSQGMKINEVPLSLGIWQELCAQAIHNKNMNLKVEKKNSQLLKQFNTTTQALPYATVLLNQQLEIKWINQASNQILGIIQNKDEGTKIDNILTDSQFVAILFSDRKIEQVEIQHPLDDSKKVHLKLIKLSEKEYLLVGRDITEQESLRESRKAFVDNASHELRTPLTVITGYLEMLYDAKDIPNSWNSAIAQALEQSTRMEKIIDDMLKLSSIEHERYLERDNEVVDMPRLLNLLFKDVKNSSLAGERQFIANIDSQLKITGNKQEIISVCLNLLNNAVIHTSAKTCIELKWFLDNNCPQLWVCDNGSGINKKHVVHLTERFYRVDNSTSLDSKNKNIHSTGLGLAIVKQICINHGARLEIESEINQGTCFKISFPETRKGF